MLRRRRGGQSVLVTEDSSERPRLDADELDHLLTWVQDGVVARWQLRDLGAREHDIVRMVRRRELAIAHPGVSVNHTGPLTWDQRTGVAVLACWPAALSHQSACPGGPSGGPVHVAVDHRRSVQPPTRVVVHRTADFVARVDWRKSPPRIHPGHADVALLKRSVSDRFGVFSDACQTRDVSVSDIRAALASRRRVPVGGLLEALLDDLDTGACSVLERGYLDLERRHGLPAADRQRSERSARAVGSTAMTRTPSKGWSSSWTAARFTTTPVPATGTRSAMCVCPVEADRAESVCGDLGWGGRAAHPGITSRSAR